MLYLASLYIDGLTPQTSLRYRLNSPFPSSPYTRLVSFCSVAGTCRIDKICRINHSRRVVRNDVTHSAVGSLVNCGVRQPTKVEYSGHSLLHDYISPPRVRDLLGYRLR
ncbi:hypothetical protein J6590_012966 [Homalodisca vitripennis]|nr:hypothetical protein J6590_012966 [Homalodisca vitripennis]